MTAPWIDILLFLVGLMTPVVTLFVADAISNANEKRNNKTVGR